MKPLDVVLIWHMHQPDYRDPLQDEVLLPWVFLHAVKDYGDMLQTAVDHGIRVTFNLVPTLLEQLREYASKSLRDRWLELARRDPQAMSDGERASLVQCFFSVHAERHIRPHARYRELAEQRALWKSSAWQRFSEADLRDLQVWFLLSWSGYYLRREPGVVADLLAKGRNFDEQDKHRLLQAYQEVVEGILARFRQAEDEGAVELSVTPYAHPILPLLCDSGEAARAREGVLLPKTPFRFPEDARRQVRLGLASAGDFFGVRSRGIWPSEGGLSESVVRIMADEGAVWTAGDEALLEKSLPGGLGDRTSLYRPYSYLGLPLLFRDRELSDRIGFVYATWPSQTAAADLLDRLRALAQQVPGGVVTLILDGENCWEGYEENGFAFLQAVYRGLADSPVLRAVTFSEALASRKPEPLKVLAPGSWINGDFDIWIGHPEENCAWEWLGEARRALQSADADCQGEGWPHLLRAEGSDWFWWFGEHHRSEQAETFDQLFRHHLQAFYRAIRKPVPPCLHYPLRGARRSSRVYPPTESVSPVIDGRLTDYFEWHGAGTVELGGGGAMHNASFDLLGFFYGYDENFFYLRFDFRQPVEQIAGPDGELLVRLQAEGVWEARLAARANRVLVQSVDGAGGGEGPGAAGTIAEMGLPLKLLDLKPGGALNVSLTVLDSGRELARWPAGGELALIYPGPDAEAPQWPL
ncbi:MULTISPECIES: glycoside hydrolase family 57 protein [Syntrophotalea]|jgi:alpha-amylase/alpha-mannosidase (GH57 family)|uniref:Glycoside hydrolase family 57 N-terminal domain-containing protein n=1 Tax=Syntrophotalea acetylenica TaxID=29542 RepID=A0A1L3GJY0_SYNAC|nr:glycoside hydrolase family 57 protein [Syntrophotalea acetylenica]APG26253.1 hypothetical protein A7E75_07490 [Syntrophotalea acetylenica]MDY0261295.1 glycoside hydrolase family 57 protein [Syntrophotalea acetylenica]